RDASGDRSHEPFLYSPRYTLNTAVDYTIPLPRELGELVAHADYYWKSDFYHNVGPDLYTREMLREHSYGLLNWQLSYTTANGKYELALWAQNILSKAYGAKRLSIGSGDPGGAGTSFTVAYPGVPRTFGVTGRVNF